MSEHNIEIRQGETWSMGISVYEGDGITPKVITGATVKGAVRAKPSENIIATMTCDITDALNGKITVGLSDEQTAAIPAASSYAKNKEYYFDIKLEYADGVSVYLDYGKFIVSGGVQIE